MLIANAKPTYRLLTSILDPDQAPAAELAALYHERWEIETALDELKTHLRGSKIVLRSKTPDLVRQEFYGLMMTHFAVPRFAALSTNSLFFSTNSRSAVSKWLLSVLKYE